MGGGDIGDADDYVAKGKWYPSAAQKVKALIRAGPEPGKGDDPLWCVICRKRFNSHGVFNGHLSGKEQHSAGVALPPRKSRGSIHRAAPADGFAPLAAQVKNTSAPCVRKAKTWRLTPSSR